MATETDVRAAANAAMVAVLQRVEKAAAPGGSTPKAVSELALAYRYLAGGPQPGSTTVEK